MISGLVIEDGIFGSRAVITAQWSSGIEDYVRAKNIVELELNSAKGWKGSDIGFLSRLPQLRAFTIIDLRISSIDEVQYLHKLEFLKIFTYCKTKIDFSLFPNLLECSLEWRPGAESVFDRTSLTKFFLSSYPARDTELFGKLVNLEWLSILDSSIRSLAGLKNLTRLKYLRLGNLRQLTALTGIENLAALEELDINSCPQIGSIDSIGALISLRRLNISNVGKIESLKPISRLTALEAVMFVESTDVSDGDLSYLVRSPPLKVSFRNRKHYSHRREFFQTQGA